MASHVPELPEEMLQLIFSHLQSTCDRDPETACIDEWLIDLREKQHTLASICLANKTFYRLAYAYLYRFLYVGEPGAQLMSERLLKSVMQKPELGLKVKELRVATFGTQHDVDAGHEPADLWLDGDYDRYYSENAERVIDPLPFPLMLRGELCAELGGGLQDAEIAILMSLCPNLQVLDIEAVCNFEETLLMQTMTSSGQRQSKSIKSYGDRVPFQRLRELRMNHWDTGGCLDICALDEVFGSLHLKTFKGERIHCDGQSLGPLSPGLRLTHIYLTMSLLDAEGLYLILNACRELQLFSMHWRNAFVGDTPVNFYQIGDVLHEYGENLVSLVLDAEESWSLYCEDGDCWTIPRIGDLTSLASLRHLTLQKVALFGQDDPEDDGYPKLEVQRLVDNLSSGLRSLTIL